MNESETRAELIDPALAAIGGNASNSVIAPYNIKNISIYGQESSPNTCYLPHMNIAMHTIEANLGKRNIESIHSLSVTDRSNNREEMRSHAH
jgi:type I restriction-modification system DNA methylase subunit